MLRFVLLLMVVLSGCQSARGAEGRTPSHFDVRDYGAIADGKTKSTDAIRRAIDAAVWPVAAPSSFHPANT